MSPEELQKKREEAERKARRGEIDPMHEFAFQVIGQVSLCHFRFPINVESYITGDWDLEARDDGLHVRGPGDAGRPGLLVQVRRGQEAHVLSSGQIPASASGGQVQSQSSSL